MAIKDASKTSTTGKHNITPNPLKGAYAEASSALPLKLSALPKASENELNHATSQPIFSGLRRCFLEFFWAK